MLVSAIDSYYMYVKGQMATLGAQITVQGQSMAQPFGGVVNARDWPQTPPIEGALYLLVMNAVPMGGTRAQLQYEQFLQWVWLIVGADIAGTSQEQSRANRYRTDQQIQENLRQANYPGFTRKGDFSADAFGNVTSVPASSVYPVSDWEDIRWSPLRFMPKPDKDSGVIYGAAAVELYSYSDVSSIVA